MRQHGLLIHTRRRIPSPGGIGSNHVGHFRSRHAVLWVYEKWPLISAVGRVWREECRGAGALPVNFFLGQSILVHSTRSRAGRAERL